MSSHFNVKNNFSKHENISIDQPQTDQIFKNQIFSFIGAFEITFTNCDFSFCKFVDAYFKNCTFVNCRFVGAKFNDSNFTRSTFRSCRFDYAEFKNTHVRFEEIMPNLPAGAAPRRRVLVSLRKNYESLGERDSIRNVLGQEIQAQTDFIRDAIKGEQQTKGYYPSTFKAKMDLAKINFGWHFWGYSEHPLRFVRSLFILIFSICLAALIPPISISTYPWLFDIVSTAQDAIYTFLGVNAGSINSILGNGAKAMIALARLIAISLLTSSLIRRFGWR